MKTKDEFIARWQDELSGFVLAAFANQENERVDMAAKARFMLLQLRRVRELLGKMHDDLAGGVRPIANGVLPAAKPATTVKT